MAKRTIRALYATEAEAARARAQLAAAGFDDVEIVTRDGDGSGNKLERLAGRERLQHWRGELERGRVFLAVKVDALLETQAAEIIDATSLGQIVRDVDIGRGDDLGPAARM